MKLPSLSQENSYKGSSLIAELLATDELRTIESKERAGKDTGVGAPYMGGELRESMDGSRAKVRHI